MWFNVSRNDDGSLTLVPSDIAFKNATELVLSCSKKGAVQPSEIIANVDLFGALPGEKLGKIKSLPEWLILRENMATPLPVIDRSEFLAFQAWKASQVSKVA